MTISVADYAAECAAQGLRGDYSVCRTDFTVAQGYEYSAEEQAVWRTLCDRQTKLTRKLAHRSYLGGVAALGLLDRIPDFDEVSEKLSKLTGWEIVAVPGLIPAGPFFDHLAHRRFPVTNWLRTKEELDYIVEPDMFHDFFGHVPILTQPVFADFMQAYGDRAGEAIALVASMVHFEPWLQGMFYLTGRARSIQAMRRYLLSRGVASGRIRCEPYWAEGKQGL